MGFSVGVQNVRSAPNTGQLPFSFQLSIRVSLEEMLANHPEISF